MAVISGIARHQPSILLLSISANNFFAELVFKLSRIPSINNAADSYPD